MKAKIVHKVAALAVQDNKLFVVRRKGEEEWDMVTVTQGNWLTEERAIVAKFQRIIGCPIEVRGRLGDFEMATGRGDVESLGVFIVDLKGGIFLRDETIEEWRYITFFGPERARLREIVKEKVITSCIKSRLLIWPEK